MKSLPQTQRILVSAVLASLTVIHCGRAAEGPATVTILAPVFAPGLAKLKQATGFIADQPNQSSTDWKPNLQLLVGVKAVEGSRLTIYFVLLTTLPPPPPNSLGQPWQPVLRTNGWAWSPSNRAQFITTHYPVRVRVFEETGRLLKEGQTPMAWGMLTNGLMDLCRVSLETYGNQTNASLAASEIGRVAEKRSAHPKGNKPDAPNPQINEGLARATGGGFTWMFGMLSDLQTVPTVADVWDKAQCAIRWPGAWTIATSLVNGFTFMLVPRVREVTLANAAAADRAGPLYRLPVDLNSDKRNLGRVEIMVGPAHGAEMLLAGIRSIHAVHPTKLRQEFLAQVLAAGSVREP